MAPRDDVRYLSGSENRVAFLRRLREDPRRPADLARECGASRATVQRALAGFQEREWARKADGAYELTLAGSLVLERYEDLVDTVQFTADASELLGHLDHTETLTPDVFADATVVTATPDDPHAPLNYYLREIEGVDTRTFRGVVPVASPIFDRAHEFVTRDDVEASIVIGANTLKAAQSSYPDSVDAAATTGLTVYVHPDPPGFGLTILDDRVFLGAYDDQGRTRATLDGDCPALQSWAVERYESLVADATPLTELA